MSAIVKTLVIILLISGCAVKPHAVQTTIAPGLLFTLPPLEQDAHSFEAAQVVFGNAGPEPIQFQTQIKAGGGEIVVVVLDSLGRRGLMIQWDEAGVSTDVAPWVPAEVRPLNILADIVIAHWPAPAVRAGLKGTGARVEQIGGTRIISFAGREIVRVDYDPGFDPPWGGSLVIKNLAMGYTLKIASTLTRL